jgi:hypothetical protein
MSKVFYSGTDGALLEGAANFSTLITAGPGPLGLTAAQATAYATLNTTFASAYATSSNPVTRTKVTVAAKDTARAALVANTRLLANIVYSTPGVTNAQKLSLGLRLKAPPTPVPQPSSAPLVDFISTVARTVKVRVHDGTTPKRAKPPGVKSATVFSFVGPTAPATVAGWKYEGVSNKSVFDIVFPDTVANGALIWISAVWNNAKNQSGPPSDPVSINIPGGGMSMAA